MLDPSCSPTVGRPTRAVPSGYASGFGSAVGWRSNYGNEASLSLGVKLKTLVMQVGRRTHDRHLARLRSALGYLEIGALVRESLGSGRLVMGPDRFSVFAAAIPKISGHAPLYLEFGVFEGETMRWWSQHLDTPGARFVGFDSFEGLPEAWRPGFAAGQFETSGPPSIADSRVEFVAGWFDETLPTFAIPDHDQLIVNVDADLYSSAATVLTWVAPHLRRGSLLYFDELADRDHELRALREFLAATDVELMPIAVGAGGAHLLFEVQ